MPDSATPDRLPGPPATSRRPFVLLLAVALVSLAIPMDRLRPLELGVALVLCLALGGLHLWLHRPAPRSRSAWVLALPALGSFVAIAVIRDATGGSASGVTALVTAPVFYLALVGTARQLWAAVVLTALTFVVPLLVVGGPHYTGEDWRRAMLWTAIAAVVGPVVQSLVRRLQAESDQARRAQSQLQTVLDSAELSAVIVTDADGLITSFGVGAERLLGMSATDVVGRVRFDALNDPAETAQAAGELGLAGGFAVFAALASARADSRIWTWTRGDGSPVSVRTGLTELREDGRLLGYLAVGIDATEGVRTAQALRDAEQRWRVVMDHLPDTTLILTDDQLNVTLVSGAGSMREKIEDRSGRPLAQVVSPGNVEILTDLATRALAGEPPATVDLNSARTGHEHQVAVMPLRYATGATDALILARDISRERARERALLQAKERAQRMFADAPVAIVLHDADGLVLSANPAALALLESGREQLVGSDLARVGSIDQPDVAHYLAALADRPEGAEARWRLQIGSQEKFLSLAGRPLRDDPDHPDLVLTHIVDRTEQHRYEERLVHLADHDPLTGLANRRRFGVELERHLDACNRYGAEGALLILDLDHFKQVNDTLGHGVGDQLLVSVAEMLTADLRASDTVARLGGDEFAVLLPRVSSQDVDVVASSLVSTVRRAMRRHEGPAGEVTLSVGVALIEGRDLTSELLMGSADVALYQAKARGRDQYAVYDARDGAAAPLVALPGGLSTGA